MERESEPRLLLNEDEASRVICLSVPTLRKRRQRKLGPKFIKIGRLVRYPMESLREFVTNEMKVKGR